MFVLSKLFAALQSLTSSVEALSATVAEINGGLRSRLRLDEVEESTPALAHNGEDSGNGSRRRKAAAN